MFGSIANGRSRRKAVAAFVAIVALIASGLFTIPAAYAKATDAECKAMFSSNMEAGKSQGKSSKSGETEAGASESTNGIAGEGTETAVPDEKGKGDKAESVDEVATDTPAPETAGKVTTTGDKTVKNDATPSEAKPVEPTEDATVDEATLAPIETKTPEQSTTGVVEQDTTAKTPKVSPKKDVVETTDIPSDTKRRVQPETKTPVAEVPTEVKSEAKPAVKPADQTAPSAVTNNYYNTTNNETTTNNTTTNNTTNNVTNVNNTNVTDVNAGTNPNCIGKGSTTDVKTGATTKVETPAGDVTTGATTDVKVTDGPTVVKGKGKVEGQPENAKPVSQPAPKPVEAGTPKNVVVTPPAKKKVIDLTQGDTLDSTTIAQTTEISTTITETPIVVTRANNVIDQPTLTFEKNCKAVGSTWKIVWERQKRADINIIVWQADVGRTSLVSLNAPRTTFPKGTHGKKLHIKGGTRGETHFQFQGVATFGNIVLVRVTDERGALLIKEAKMRNDCIEKPVVDIKTVCKAEHGNGVLMAFTNKSPLTEKFTVLRDGVEVDGSPFELKAGAPDARKFLPIDGDKAKISIRNARDFKLDQDVKLDCNAKVITPPVEPKPVEIKPVEIKPGEIKVVPAEIVKLAPNTVTEPAKASMTRQSAMQAPNVSATPEKKLASTGINTATIVMFALLALASGCAALFMRKQQPKRAVRRR